MDFQTIKSQFIPFLTNNKKIAVMISGGFDSGLLLYTCLKVSKQENLDNSFTAITVPRFDDSMVHANRIINWINKEFSTDISIEESGNPYLHHSQQTWSGVVGKMGKFNLILMGCTTNPSHLLNGPFRPKVNTRNVYQPFFDLTKKDTVKLAIELNLTDLMLLSHTCTESKLLRCGQCWQCKERAWGFEVNNYTDPGSM